MPTADFRLLVGATRIKKQKRSVPILRRVRPRCYSHHLSPARIHTISFSFGPLQFMNHPSYYSKLRSSDWSLCDQSNPFFSAHLLPVRQNVRACVKAGRLVVPPTTSSPFFIVQNACQSHGRVSLIGRTERTLELSFWRPSIREVPGGRVAAMAPQSAAQQDEERVIGAQLIAEALKKQVRKRR